MTIPVGIYGIGVYLPPTIRTNDFWPESTSSKWWNTSGGKLDRPDRNSIDDPAQAIVQEMMLKYRDDPFKGSRQRHIMGENQKTTDMEVAAATDALDAAGLQPGDIDLLLGQTTFADELLAPNVCRLHHALDLPRTCFTMQTEGICAAFVLQLELAFAMIAAGRARRALLIQSSATSRYHQDPNDPMAPWIGDAATAVIVGPVAEGYGIMGNACRTDGSYYGASPTPGDPGIHWSQSKKLQSRIRDSARARTLLLDTVKMSHEVLVEALNNAGLTASDVDFFACHQGFAWLREAVQRFTGMDQARTVDTFQWAGSTLGCNIPLVLHTALKDGFLRDGDHTALFAGASGVIFKGTILRYGGRLA